MEVLALVAVAVVVGIPASALYAVYRTRVLRGQVEGLRHELTTLRRDFDRLRRTATDPERRPHTRYDRPMQEEASRPPAGAPAPAPTAGDSHRGPERPAAPEPPIPPEPPTTPEHPAAGPAFAGAGASAGTRAPGADREDAHARRDEPRTEKPRFASVGTTASGALDIETAIGSTWILRIGLGILAIALALFARTIAPQLPNFAKVALAYAASMAFFGVGKFFEEKLERFARPVMAGGLAFGFFVAFASYFVPAMRAVPMAGSIAWMVLSMFAVLVAAERWQSEPTAILAIVLGHISAQVAAGASDVYSLVMIGFLGLTAIVLLLRHEWVNLGLLGVAGAYGAHFLWLTADRVAPAGDAGFWLSLAFLTSYYVIFLLADILWWRRGTEATEKLDPTQLRSARALGPTNLVLYVSVVTFVYFATGASIDTIEWFYITLGVVQGLLAWLYRDLNHRDYVFYPVFGTVLWTIGMFAALDALVLNLVLSAQALLLLLAAHRTGMRVFYYLSQLAMGVAFVHYVVYPPPADVTLGLLVGGLGVASVYLAKAALEEHWYGSASLLAPIHAILGGLVVLREAFGFWDASPALGLFVLGAHFVILALAIGLSGPVLVFSLTTLAVGSPFVVLANPNGSALTSLALLCGLTVSAAVLLRFGESRFGTERSGMVAWQVQAIALMGLVGGYFALDGLAPSRATYFAWMILPVLLLVQRTLADEDAAARAAAAAEQDTPAPRRTDHLAPLTCLAIAGLMIGLAGETLGPVLETPLWVALWSTLILAASTQRESRGLLLAGYALLVGGYTVFFMLDGFYVGPITLGGAHPAFYTLWSALLVVALPLAVAVALDRGVEDHPWAGAALMDPNVLLVLLLLPYLMGLLLVGTGGAAQLSAGWSFALPAAVGLVLAWRSKALRAPRAVLAVVISLLLAHGYFLLVSGTGFAWPSVQGAPLAPLLAFAMLTFASEQTAQAWAADEGATPRRRNALIVLVVLATITSMAAVAESGFVGRIWTTAGWSVLGGSMMAAGFALKSAVYRRVALALLAICIARVFAVDTVGLSDTARIGAFLVLGLILVGIALLYTRYSEELKKLI